MTLRHLLRSVLGLILKAGLCMPSDGWAGSEQKDDERLTNSWTVLHELLDIPDDVPQDLLDKADCVVVYPPC
jgi:SH3 domain-containing YSC84-like protein 1